MGALNPLFLLAGAAVALPLFLHLFQRHEARRVEFPALRYLERTEREHARRIRLRQLLLLVLRVAAVLLVVGAGAGLFLRGKGSAHPPTALAIVLDNSMSSGLVEGEARVLDRLKALALRTLADASERDRIWVILAGEPWRPASTGGPEEARRAVEEAQASAGAGNLTEALGRAAGLVSAAGMPAQEIHLLSDLQASGFDPRARAAAGDVPVVVWAPEGEPRPNHAITSLRVGGGLGPLEGQRYEVTVAAAAPAGVGDTVPVPVRVVLEGRVRSAAALPPGATVSLPLASASAGWTVGYAEMDADALSMDDRRHFAFRARPAPRVALAGDPGVFLGEAVAVLEAGGRLEAAPTWAADFLVSASGQALAEGGVERAVLVVPPGDPTLLPGFNLRLQSAGIPWRFERSAGEGEVSLGGPGIPEPLVGTRVRRWYRLSLAAEPPSPPRTLALAAGDPWAVEGTDASGRRYMLLASPLDPGSSSLPLSSALVRLVDWAAVTWAGAGSAPDERVAGMPLSAPREADAVRLPSGVELPLDGTRMLRATGDAGIYAFLSGDSVVAYHAVNPDASESDLARLPAQRVQEAAGPNTALARDEGGWERAVFRSRQGPELARTLAGVALALLLLEAAVASTGAVGRATRGVAGRVHGAS